MKCRTLAAVAILLQFYALPFASARTWGISNYEKDPNKNHGHVFGAYANYKGYQDPDISETLGLPSPLYNPTYATYDVIVLVTKTSSKIEGTELIEKGQRIRVYIREAALNELDPSQTRFILPNYDRSSGLLFYWKVSTGRTGSATPSGFFVPQKFSSEHASSLYEDAPMPWAVFFDGNVATHATLRDNYAFLGSRASHGCVRLEEQRAEDLFHLIGNVGLGEVDGITQDGRWVLDTKGNPQKGILYKTLIIIN